MIFTAVALALVPIILLALLTRRLLALPLAALVVLVGVWAITEALGRPKASRLALLESHDAEMVLVAFTYIENEAIFLWLLPPGSSVPMSYALPWRQDDAEGLVKAKREAEEGNTEMRARNPLHRSPGEPLAYPAPPPEEPSKNPQIQQLED